MVRNGLEALIRINNILLGAMISFRNYFMRKLKIPLNH